MEGPSLVLAAEQLRPFKGRVIRAVSGNTKSGKERFLGQEVRDLFSWGKHLVFQLEDCAFRVHFMLYGTFEAVVEGDALTGDYRRAREPRLALSFDNGEILMFSCSVKVFEDTRLRRSYDFSADIMACQWDPEAAYRKCRAQQGAIIADALLDQEIFAGVGNIIKNEVLSLARTNPATPVRALSSEKLREIIATARSFSKQFLRWRRKFVLRKSLRIHRKGTCPHCGGKVVRAKLGTRDRWAYWCSADQPLRA